MLTFILKLGRIQLGNKSTTSRGSLHLKIKIPSNEMLFPSERITQISDMYQLSY